MNMKKVIFTLAFLIITIISFSQELICTVSVNSDQIQGSDKKLYETMTTAIRDFVNTRKWSGYVYKQEEKIECSMLLTLSERVSTEEFKGTIQVQSRRPIYGSSYNSVMLNLLDKDFQFKYLETAPLDFDDNTIISNLASVIAYYCYIIVGLDFDSYTMNGGAPYFTKAQNIVNLSQNAPEKGWKAFENRKNRYWLVENLQNQAYAGFHTALYNYHLKGFDIMKESVDNGRTGVISAIEAVKKVNADKPSLYFTTLFIDTKRDEIVSLFAPAPPGDKTRVVQFLKEIDPVHSNDYNAKILNGK
jgi:hypothetical protein